MGLAKFTKGTDPNVNLAVESGGRTLELGVEPRGQTLWFG